jgi:rhodanese-related sulfurtransferase
MFFAMFSFRAVDATTVEELKSLLSNSEAELIDVRNTDEYMEEHIEGAKNIPLPILDVKQISGNKKRIVVHCKSGKRGEKARELLKKQDPSLRVSNLAGGILEWKKSDLPLRSINSTLPIMSRVQIIAGSLILFGSAAAFFINPYFLAIPALTGAGLLFAGITGRCGMANLLMLVDSNK